MHLLFSQFRARMVRHEEVHHKGTKGTKNSSFLPLCPLCLGGEYLLLLCGDYDLGREPVPLWSIFSSASSEREWYGMKKFTTKAQRAQRIYSSSFVSFVPLWCIFSSASSEREWCGMKKFT
ncbi:hypothetical protein, partial [uncultured Lamprocystis sp.]